MPKTAVFNMAGEKVSELELNESIFAIEPNETVMHLAVVNYLANQRQGTQSTLTRSEVSGGGKPYQKKEAYKPAQTREPRKDNAGSLYGKIEIPSKAED